MKTYKYFLIATILGVAIHAVGYAANKCCQNQSAHPSCTGCVKLGGLPYYVNVGTNSVQKCKNTPQSSECDESHITCVQIVNAQMYSDDDCSNIVGTSTIHLKVRQCGGDDHACGGG